MRFERMHARRAVAAAVLVLTTVVPALAGDGDPDTSFGSGGGTATVSAAFLSYGGAIAEGPDGSVVVGGQTVAPNGVAFRIGAARLTAKGATDATFGANHGGVRVDFSSGSNGSAEAVRVFADGSTLVVGWSDPSTPYSSIVLARYAPDGSPDAAFGDGGRVVDSLGGWASASAVAVDAEGRLVVAGTAGRRNATATTVAIARYLADGSRDETFGTGGFVTYSFGKARDGASGVAVDAEGRIVVVGYSGDERFAHPKAAALRALPDGSLDATFGTGGKATFAPPGTDALANACALAPDGRLVFVCTAAAGNATRGYAIGRLDDRGALDATFGAGGFALVSPADTPAAHAEFTTGVVVQADGKAILCGFQRRGSVPNSPRRAHLARLTSDGALDPTFGDGGFVAVAGTNDAVTAGLARFANGRVGVTGTTFSGSTGRVFAAVFLEDGTPDFRLDVPATVEIPRGTSGTIEVGVVRRAGHAEPVEVTAPDASPFKVKLAPTTATATGSNASFLYKAKKKAALGDHEIVFTATDGVLTRTATVVLRVVE